MTHVFCLRQHIPDLSHHHVILYWGARIPQVRSLVKNSPRPGLLRELHICLYIARQLYHQDLWSYMILFVRCFVSRQSDRQTDMTIPQQFYLSVHCHSRGMKPFSCPYCALVITRQWISGHTDWEAGGFWYLAKAMWSQHARKGELFVAKVTEQVRLGLVLASGFGRGCKFFYTGQRNASESLSMFENVLFVHVIDKWVRQSEVTKGEHEIHLYWGIPKMS